MTDLSPTETQVTETPFDWRKAIAQFQTPDVRHALWQLANTMIPYFILWYLAYRAMEVSYLLTIAIGVLAGGMLVRIFIIFHDCGHGSFLPSRRANDLVGVITGIMTFTPYYHWRHSHAVHHSSAGDLDRRGTGDVWTLTVDEYLGLPPIEQLWYRLYRHPLTLLIFGPLVQFLLLHRFAERDYKARERRSVVITNLGLLAITIIMSALIGFQNYVLVQLPILMVAATAGVWLFYVQHQFEDVYWERHDNWDYVAAALQGSSFYKLPKVLQWFSGNIGFHHIHHLSPRIPNYKLEECYNATPDFQEVKPLTLLTSLKSLTFRLWDEENQRLIGFGELQRQRRTE